MEVTEFVGDVNADLTCSICLKVLLGPRSCRDGHTFCLICISDWLKSHSTCPACRTPLDTQDMCHNRVAENMIGALMARCPNASADPADDAPRDRTRPRLSAAPLVPLAELATANSREGQASPAAEQKPSGCDWVGLHSERPSHTRVCVFQAVRCPHEGCGESMQRRRLAEHTDTCPDRLEKCVLCDEVLPHRQLQRHASECLAVELSCEKGCGARCLRRDLAAHVAECPHEPVPCPVDGCTACPMRKDLEHHKTTGGQAHTQILLQRLKEQRENHRELKLECEKRAAEVKRLREDLRQRQDLRQRHDMHIVWKILNIFAKATSGESVYSSTFTMGPVGTSLQPITMHLKATFSGVGPEQHMGMHIMTDDTDRNSPLPITGSRIGIDIEDLTRANHELHFDDAADVISNTQFGRGISRFLKISKIRPDEDEVDEDPPTPRSITVHAAIRIHAPATALTVEDDY
jgi:hypothetical protein